MPKRVDHQERRQHIAAALLRVISRDGLEAVSLRHVATEAGVTAGMVQHYFPSKGSMMDFAMRTASARYEARVTAQLALLGEEPEPHRVLRTLLAMMIPTDDSEEDDGHVALAFQAYAATHPDAADYLEEGNELLRNHFAELVRAADGRRDADLAATILLAAAEGLGVHVLSSRLPTSQARASLDHLVDALLDAP
ncbi:TetR/AcrR family transcriptional regulator [Leucobacter sp. wl10]|uniref:TetR/AcrR family transcriptional regulator n=1 Tax=Leucobacter sp. wl10 TaxID=2304677 RepID=UPI000E5AD199|nr:TetR/AcrR family transcriptional regulator [Leucobacter sp. wl10]RGE21420.1 TetR/AcrR family transcriptional regulator [Leucobacter sp. wl10]